MGLELFLDELDTVLLALLFEVLAHAVHQRAEQFLFLGDKHVLAQLHKVDHVVDESELGVF